MSVNPEIVDLDGQPIEVEFEILLKPSEAAHILRITSRTLNNYARQGKIRSVRTQGGHRRYPASAVRLAAQGKWDEVAADAKSPKVNPADTIVVTEG
jgi:excisionase family DNA binding protein